MELDPLAKFEISPLPGAKITVEFGNKIFVNEEPLDNVTTKFVGLDKEYELPLKRVYLLDSKYIP